MSATFLDVEVDGLSCAGCVGRLEKALNAQPGVIGANVNLATNRARIEVSDSVALNGALAAMTDAGYPARSHVVRFAVSGMTCGSCVGRVEKALLAVPGVVSASVNLATEQAEVTTTSRDETALAKAVEGLGYTVYHGARAQEDAHQTDDAEIRRLGTRTALAAALTVPVFVLEMGGHLVPSFHHLIERTIGTQTSWAIQFVLASLVLLWPGRGFLVKGFPALFRGAPDMNALVALGTGAAWLYSSIALFAPGLLPADSRAVYFEAAAVIVTLILLGRWLEARAKGRTGDAVRKLIGLQPATALVMRDGAPQDIPLADLRQGDRILLRPGARVPADGVVLEGQGFVDESMITGEPAPVAKASGDPVTAGTVNGNGSLQIQADAVGEATVLAQIVRMVQEAQGARLPIQDLVNRITLWFVPAVMAVATVTVILWLVFGPDPVLSHALVAGVSVLIIACPCAMGLATPVSIMVGTGRAADMGVLFRRGVALQRLQDIAVVAFDKTGTLTVGRPAVTEIEVAPGFEADRVLMLAASVETASEHPIATAVCDAAGEQGLRLSPVQEFNAETGEGVVGRVDGTRVTLGAARLMARLGIDTGDLGARADALADQARTPVFVAVDDRIAGLIAVADRIKPEARRMVDDLHALGLRVTMITGDASGTAQAVARDLGIDDVLAEVMPDQKADAVRRLAEQGPVAFVGDGINDAPALATADVGIAIGTGTDIAIEAADVVLMSGDLSGVGRALTISRATMANIRQNLAWAFGYNILLIPVAAGALFVFGGPLLSPALAAGAMALSSVFVLGNALRLQRVGREQDRAKKPSGNAFVPREGDAS